MRILQSPITRRFYAVSDNYKPGGKKHDVTADIEAIVQAEALARTSELESNLKRCRDALGQICGLPEVSGYSDTYRIAYEALNPRNP